MHEREQKRPVFHTNLAEQRGSASLTKSSKSLRTAEVCKIPEDCSTALDSYVRGVIAQGIDVLFMVVCHDIRTESIREINAISRCRGNRSSCAENFGQLDSNKPVSIWPAVTTTVGFEVQERPLPADTASSWQLRKSVSTTWKP